MTPPPRRNGPPFPVARKSLGQHFLIDPNIVRKIVRLAELQPGETVLEIGPGRGILTEALLEASGLVVAIELDPALCDYLRTTLGSRPNLPSYIVVRRIDAFRPPRIQARRSREITPSRLTESGQGDSRCRKNRARRKGNP